MFNYLYFKQVYNYNWAQNGLMTDFNHDMILQLLCVWRVVPTFPITELNLILDFYCIKITTFYISNRTKLVTVQNHVYLHPVTHLPDWITYYRQALYCISFHEKIIKIVRIGLQST